MAQAKRTKKQIAEELERLQAEHDALPDEEEEEEVEEEGDEHIIVFKGSKGLAKFLESLGASDDDEDEPEDEEGEEGEEEPPAKKPVKKTGKPPADEKPASRSRWFKES